MTVARDRQTATLLLNGKVLIAGGFSGGSPVSSAELYDPATGTFSPTGPMLTTREGHTTTRLGDGNVLIAGGETIVSGGYIGLASADTPSGTFSMADDMATERRSHSATLLVDGNVLITGGVPDSTSAELFGRNWI